ncbi:MAG: hypothetical protein WC289_00955 [Patescibacteria group bacterium]|jgi:hypothetical protein
MENEEKGQSGKQQQHARELRAFRIKALKEKGASTQGANNVTHTIEEKVTASPINKSKSKGKRNANKDTLQKDTDERSVNNLTPEQKSLIQQLKKNRKGGISRMQRNNSDNRRTSPASGINDSERKEGSANANDASSAPQRRIRGNVGRGILRSERALTIPSPSGVEFEDKFENERKREFDAGRNTSIRSDYRSSVLRSLVSDVQESGIDLDTSISKPDNLYLKTFSTLARGASGEGDAGLINDSLQLGRELRKRMQEGEMGAFYLVLVLAIIKDFIEVLEFVPVAGIGVKGISLVLTLIIIGFTGIFSGVAFKRFVIKKMLGTLVIAAIAEIFPGTDIFPTATLTVILMKMKADKERDKHKELLEKVKSHLGKIGASIDK